MDSLIVVLVIAIISIMLARIIVKKNLETDKRREVLKHPETGDTRVTYEGFSWPAFFFTPIWCIVKDLYLQALLSVFFPLLVWIVAGFKGNQWHYDSLIEKGYLPKEQINQSSGEADNLTEIEKLHDLKESGALTEEEFEEKKKELL